MARIVAEKSESSFSQVIHSAGVRRFGEAQDLPVAKCNFVIHRQSNNVTSARCMLFILKALLILAKHTGYKGRAIMSGLNENKLRRILRYMLDEKEFFGPYGIRSISKFHKEYPYILQADGREFRVSYQPAESETALFGGNSNWRGPVWFPTNFLILRAFLHFYLYYGDDFKVECPTGSGKTLTLYEVATELSRRLYSIFLKDPANNGRRPVYGSEGKFQSDPHWRDLILFYEYFHGDNGAGIGASHQTGWTGLVARLIGLSVGIDPKQFLNFEHRPVLREASSPQAGAAAGG